MSGGFTPGLRTVSDGVTAEASFLASEHGVVKRSGVTLASSLVSADGDGNKIVKAGTVLGKVTSTGKYAPYAANVSEVQTVTVDATGGTFTLTFDGETTGAIAEGATAAAVQAALLLLSNLNTGDVVVTGDAGGPFTVTFGGQYAGTNVPTLTAAAGSLTGGAGTVVIATDPQGAAGATGIETAAGILLETANLKDGDVIAGMLIHGSVLEVRCTGVDAAAKSALSQISFQ